jgi:hypothetical protein
VRLGRILERGVDMKKLSKKLIIKFLRNNGAYPEELRYARRHWSEKVAITPNFLAKARTAGIVLYPEVLPGKLRARLCSAYEKADTKYGLRRRKAGDLYNKRTSAACTAYETKVASIEKACILERDKALCDVLQDLLGDERKAEE